MIEEEEDMEVEGEVLKGSRSYEAVDDSSSSNLNTTNSGRRPYTVPNYGNMPRPLHSVQSSPQLLNQIFEEGESDEDENILPMKISSQVLRSRNTMASPEVIRKFEARKKRLGASPRGTSCSSSDASDTDEKKDNRKRKEKLKHRFHRKDSSDHSSDNDGGPGNNGGNNGGNTNLDNGPGGEKPDKGGGGHDTGHQRGNGKRSPAPKDNRNTGGKQQNGAVHMNGEALQVDGHSRKTSNLSVASNLSNLSLTSLSSKSSKYLVEAPNASPTVVIADSTNTPKDVADMNEENRYRTKVIHVRSKEFSDLLETFGREKERLREDNNQVPRTTPSPTPNSAETAATHSNSNKVKRRSRDKIKTDINKNGLKGSVIENKNPPELCQQGVLNRPTTKCCSLV